MTIWFLSTLMLVCVSGDASQEAQDWQTLVERALDDSAAISLENVKLADLFSAIEKEAGVPVRMAPDYVALLPYGAQTTFAKAQFRDVSIREGLTALIAGLGMRIEVVKDHVEIVPKPALLRIGRRATWSELDLLSQLSAMHPGTTPTDLETLQPRIQFRVPQREAWSLLRGAVRQVGAGPGDEVMDVACRMLGWSWYPEGEHLVVLQVGEQIARQLQRQISIRIRRKPLTRVMEQLGQKCGVVIRPEPGALSAIPAHIRDQFILEVEGYTVAEALDAIASQTNLGYVITPDGVVFYNPREDQPMAAQAPAAGSAAQATATGAMSSGSDPVIGMVPVRLDNGTEINLLIRASDLPPELTSELVRKKLEVIESLRKGAAGKP